MPPLASIISILLVASGTARSSRCRPAAPSACLEHGDLLRSADRVDRRAASVDRNVSMASLATSSPTMRPPMHTTLAWLCARASRAVVTSWTTAARTPWTLLAAMEMPIPVPQAHRPSSARPSGTARPTAAPNFGVVDRTPRESVPRSSTSWPSSARCSGQELLQAIAGVVGADRDAHGRSIPRPSRRSGAPRPRIRSAPMALDPRTPVLVGVGQVTAAARRPGVPLTERAEPVELMARALRAAAGRTAAGRRGLGPLWPVPQSLRVILPLSWRYVNPGLLVAQRLGIDPGGAGPDRDRGEQPADRGEPHGAGRSRPVSSTWPSSPGPSASSPVWPPDATPSDRSCPGRRSPPTRHEPVMLGVERAAGDRRRSGPGASTGPATSSPCSRTPCAAASGDDDRRRISDEGLGAVGPVLLGGGHQPLRVVATGPHGRGDPMTGPANRMVSFPYPKLMNANDRVDQGAAFILCSVRGGPQRRGTRGPVGLPGLPAADATTTGSSRTASDLRSSPAIRLAGQPRPVAGRRGHRRRGPRRSVLVLPLRRADRRPRARPRPSTIRAGRSRSPEVSGFAGGPGNNYVSHSIATMAERLRADPGALGLVTGLGWYSTKHAVGVWSTTPPAARLPSRDPPGRGGRASPGAPAHRTTRAMPPSRPTPSSTTATESPSVAIVALLTDDGRRTWGNVTDRDDMLGLMEDEGCGRKARCPPTAGPSCDEGGPRGADPKHQMPSRPLMSTPAASNWASRWAQS